VQSAPLQGAQPAGDASKPAKLPSTGDRRRAVRLYLASSKLFAAGRFEDAMRGFAQAAALDPTNPDYALADGVARSHAVSALIQTAAGDRIRGDIDGAHAALNHALEIDPRNIEATQHLFELGEGALTERSTPLYEQSASAAASPVTIAPVPGFHSFHIRADQRQTIQQVFRAYGLEAILDDSVRSSLVRLDIENASFAQMQRTLQLLTGTFFVPLDEHRVLVARDTRENRLQFTRQVLETLYLSGLSATELTDVNNLAKNVFGAQQSATNASAGTITLRAPASSLNAFNATMRGLLEGRSQVLLEVRVLQLAHTTERNTGVQLPQTMSAFNVYAEEQSILTSNQALVQQIVSSGLAAPGDTLAILGILLASGQVTSALFSNGIALFGGGLTQSALAPGAVTTNLNLNSSDSRALDRIQLRLGDGEEGTVREGTRYPIQTSSFSSLSPNVPNIPGLTGAGSSGGLSSLLAQYANSIPNVPQVEYQDLGLTLKATPNVMRNGDVALTLDLKIDALSGGSVNGNPILNSRSYSGVVQLREGEGVAVVSEMDKNTSLAISGMPGLSEIPGMNNLTGKDTQQNNSTLLIVVTPHVVRGTQAAGHTPRMPLDLGTTSR
jgi:type II secretory pathway component GspD/PulD (secretin)